MKILIVSNMYPDANHPSAGIFVKKFCDEISKIGIEYDLGIMRWYDNKVEKVVNYIKFYAGVFIKILYGKYDLIYVHYASNSSVPVLWASKLKKMTIYTNVHGSDVVPENKTQDRFQKYTRKILKQSEKIIVPSEYFKRYVCDKYQLDPSIIHIYPSSGIDMNMFRQLPSEIIDLKFGKINKNLKIFCYVGRISANKGWDTYLKAIKILKDRKKNANYILVGNGKEKSQLENLAKKLSLEDDLIRFDLLPQEELVTIYNVSDAFIFPTRREGESLGLVAIEAMACGTPVIASDFAAPKYYVQNEINGYKFDMNSPDELADIMEKFISGEYSKKELVTGCLKTANMYNSKAIAGKLKEIFEVR